MTETLFQNQDKGLGKVPVHHPAGDPNLPLLPPQKWRIQMGME